MNKTSGTKTTTYTATVSGCSKPNKTETVANACGKCEASCPTGYFYSATTPSNVTGIKFTQPVSFTGPIELAALTLPSEGEYPNCWKAQCASGYTSTGTGTPDASYTSNGQNVKCWKSIDIWPDTLYFTFKGMSYIAGFDETPNNTYLIPMYSLKSSTGGAPSNCYMSDSSGNMLKWVAYTYYGAVKCGRAIVQAAAIYTMQGSYNPLLVDYGLTVQTANKVCANDSSDPAGRNGGYVGIASPKYGLSIDMYATYGGYGINEYQLKSGDTITAYVTCGNTPETRNTTLTISY